jgi:hypothetical protein
VSTDGTWLALAAAAGLAVAGARRRGSTSRPFRFSGLTCPAATADLVNWSTGDWSYPSPAEELEWLEFRDEVQPQADDLSASGYLGWDPAWGEPFDEWLEGAWVTYPSWTGGPGRRVREVGGGTHAWYRTELPSGLPAYVWVGSGIEHWWTPGGESIDVYGEQKLITAVEQRMEALEQSTDQDLTVQDTMRTLAKVRTQ